MKTLYLDLSMGAAGDMISAALLELLPDPEGFLADMQRRMPDVTLGMEKTSRRGVAGTRFKVAVSLAGGEEVEEASVDIHPDEIPNPHLGHTESRTSEHAHESVAKRNLFAEHAQGVAAESKHVHGHGRSFADAVNSIRQIGLNPKAEEDAIAVYTLLAEAEAKAHGCAVEQVHFHEVGNADAVADIAVTCQLMSIIAPDAIVASPVHVGSGFVKCAHGILPVPAPATAALLTGIPMYGGSLQAELCTPTGAAIVKHFVQKFQPLPLMKTEAVGCGLGSKDFAVANCLRAFLGTTEDDIQTVTMLSCNIDDMTGEEIGFASERLLDAGALDVYTTAIFMKKGRPGVLIRLICRNEDADALAGLMFKHTSTLGIREIEIKRRTLARNITEEDTVFGRVRLKNSYGYGAERSKFEYDDAAAIAKDKGVSLREVSRALEFDEKMKRNGK